MEDMAQSYLYHYTNVSSLAMILKNKNIRFNPLTVLDDMEEEKIQDKQRYGKWVFVSSWTEDAVESIPMWRIKLPKYPFRKYKLTIDNFNRIEREFPLEVENMDIVIPPDDYIYSDYYLFNYHQKKILHKVSYTSDNNKLYPRIANFEDNTFEFVSSNLGVYKNTYWSFQKEWRYILYFLPMSFQEFLKNPFQPDLTNIFACTDLPFNHYFLELNEEKFKDMEITLCPQISDGNRIIVNLLIEKYNPTALIQESALLGKIR